jgi:hypothetical protein
MLRMTGLENRPESEGRMTRDGLAEGSLRVRRRFPDHNWGFLPGMPGRRAPLGMTGFQDGSDFGLNGTRRAGRGGSWASLFGALGDLAYQPFSVLGKAWYNAGDLYHEIRENRR